MNSGIDHDKGALNIGVGLIEWAARTQRDHKRVDVWEGRVGTVHFEGLARFTVEFGSAYRQAAYEQTETNQTKNNNRNRAQ